VFETYGVLLVRSRDKRRSAMMFLDLIEVGGFAVERVRRADEERAITILKKQKDKTYSFCDALSFSVMERLGIADAVAFDRHFREYGRFNIL
jgi:predicted nucleic acid-binding protein